MNKLLIKIIALSVIGFLISACQSGTSNDSTKVNTRTDNNNHLATQTKAATNNKGDVDKNADHLNTGGLQWTTFDALQKEGYQNNGKKYLVDVYTEWCGWCKVMDKKTFTDEKVQAYLRENFNLIKFDAEQKEDIIFKKRIYEWQSGGKKGINKLAIELLGNRMSYPTMVYLDEDLNKIRSIPGFKKPDQLLAELKAINES